MEEVHHSINNNYAFNKKLAVIDNMFHNDLVVSFEDVLVWINQLDGAKDYSGKIESILYNSKR